MKLAPAEGALAAAKVVLAMPAHSLPAPPLPLAFLLPPPLWINTLTKIFRGLQNSVWSRSFKVKVKAKRTRNRKNARSRLGFRIYTLENPTGTAITSASSVRIISTPPRPLARTAHHLPPRFFEETSVSVGLSTIAQT